MENDKTLPILPLQNLDYTQAGIYFKKALFRIDSWTSMVQHQNGGPMQNLDVRYSTDSCIYWSPQRHRDTRIEIVTIDKNTKPLSQLSVQHAPHACSIGQLQF